MKADPMPEWFATLGYMRHDRSVPEEIREALTECFDYIRAMRGHQAAVIKLCQDRLGDIAEDADPVTEHLLEPAEVLRALGVTE